VTAAGAALAVLLALAALALLSASRIQPRRHRPAAPGPARDVPPGDFRIGTALEHVRVIAAGPHPAGSAANAAVRDYLLGTLRDLGLQPTVRRTLATRESRTAPPVLGWVENIVCPLPYAPAEGVVEDGPGDGGIVLMAHYDSAPGAPGACDNAASVAVLLEVARALTRSGPQPRRVTLVLTDAEEAGLLGASAEAPGWTADPRVSAVLNLDARGVSGAAVMFQTGPEGRRMASVLARTPRPVATSLAEEVYRRLPNQTDFTVSLAAGFSGMNLAFINGSAHYHTAGDNLANLSRATLQHLGETTLGATRALLAEKRRVKPGGAVYFPLPGVLARYPQWLARPLAVLALALYAVCLVLAGRTPALRVGVGAVALCGLGALALPLAAAASGIAGWHLLARLRPQIRGFFAGDSHRSGWYKLGMLLLTCAAGCAMCALLAARYGPVPVWLGVSGCVALGAAVTAYAAPGASYLFAWPALIGPAVLAATAPVASHWTSGGAADWLPAAAAGAAAAVLVFAPVMVLLPNATGIAGMHLSMALAAFPAAAIGCVALPLPHGVVAQALAAAGLLCVGTGAWLDRPDALRPRHVSLLHVTDLDRDRAWWMTRDDPPAPWIRARTGTTRDGPTGGVPTVTALPARPFGSTAAVVPGCALDAQRVQETEAAGVRTLSLRLRVPGGASWLWFLVDPAHHELDEIAVDGLRVPQPESGRSGGRAGERWTAGFGFHLPPEELLVRLRFRGAGALSVHLAAHTHGLPDDALRQPLPPAHTWSPVASNVTIAMRELRL